MASLQQRLLKLELNLKKENESSVSSRRRSSDSAGGGGGGILGNNLLLSSSGRSGSGGSGSSSGPFTGRNANSIFGGFNHHLHSHHQQQQHSNNNNNNHVTHQPIHPLFNRSLSGVRKLSKESLLNGNIRQYGNEFTTQQLQLQQQQQPQQNNPQQQNTNFIQNNPSVNAQCLSPRPRPKALPIGSSVRPHSPSPKSLAFNNGLNSNNNKEKVRLSDKFKQSYLLFIDGKRYQCHENDLQYIGELGSGSCGHVVKMKHLQTGRVIAVKQMRRSEDPDETKRISMDLEVLLKCHSCEYIVKCTGYLIKDTEVWICMELMATCFDKLLKKFQSPIPEPILGKIAVATVKALHYLKENHGVIHRDVKPSNILLNENGEIKLCDFGISGRLVDSKAKTRQAGCSAYIAPERIDPPDPTKPSYDIRADVWSLGISLVELAMGKFPYSECKTDFEVLSKILQADAPTLPNNGTFSTEICSFVKACLTKDYNIRPKYKQLLDHPFIKIYEKKHVDVAAWYREILRNENNKANNQSSNPFV